jgi:hypothetical protein
VPRPWIADPLGALHQQDARRRLVVQHHCNSGAPATVGERTNIAERQSLGE